MREDELYYHPAVHYAAMGREHPKSSQRTERQMAHAKQLAAAEDIAWEQEMLLRQAAAVELTGDQNMLTMMQQDAAASAELARDPNVMMVLQQAVSGQQQQQQQAQGQVEEQYAAMGLDVTLGNAQQLLAREKQALMMAQQQQQAAAYAHALPGSMSGAATNMAFPHQPLLQPSLAELPRQQENDGCDDGQLSDLTAYFGIPGVQNCMIYLGKMSGSFVIILAIRLCSSSISLTSLTCLPEPRAIRTILDWFMSFGSVASSSAAVMESMMLGAEPGEHGEELPERAHVVNALEHLVHRPDREASSSGRELLRELLWLRHSVLDLVDEAGQVAQHEEAADKGLGFERLELANVLAGADEDDRRLGRRDGAERAACRNIRKR
ncbi:hypothetical protein EJB05_14980, partial [Eragrostis curvula]